MFKPIVTLTLIVLAGALVFGFVLRDSAEVRDENQRLSEQLVAAEQTIEVLRRNQTELERRLAELQSQQAAAADEAQALRGQLATALAEARELRGTVAQLRTERDRLAGLLKAMNSLSALPGTGLARAGAVWPAGLGLLTAGGVWLGVRGLQRARRTGAALAARAPEDVWVRMTREQATCYARLRGLRPMGQPGALGRTK